LTPNITEVIYNEFSQYYKEHPNVHICDGEIAYETVSAKEAAGKHIHLTKKMLD